VRGEAAGHRRHAPDPAGQGQHRDAVGAVGQPADRNGDEAVEHREIQAADQAQLAVGDVQRVLDRLGQDRHQLPVQEVQHIDEPQHAQDDPGAAVDGGRTCVFNGWGIGRSSGDRRQGARTDRRVVARVVFKASSQWPLLELGLPRS
jgi:hypothetical protein